MRQQAMQHIDGDFVAGNQFIEQWSHLVEAAHHGQYLATHALDPDGHIESKRLLVVLVHLMDTDERFVVDLERPGEIAGAVRRAGRSQELAEALAADAA